MTEAAALVRVVVRAAAAAVALFLSVPSAPAATPAPSAPSEFPRPPVVPASRPTALSSRSLPSGDGPGGEADVSRKEVELEKKKAELELKESEVARKEADFARRASVSEEDVRAAAGRADRVGEAKDTQAARERVRISQEKVRVAEEKAGLLAEAETLSENRASLAEVKVRERRVQLRWRLIQTGSAVLAGWLLMLVIGGVVHRRVKDLKTRHTVRKGVNYIVSALVLFYLLVLWSQSIGSVTIFLGVAGAGVALALQEVILCTAGWVQIFFRRPFEVGDRVELGGVKGDVIDIRILQTSLLEIGNWVDLDQTTGRLVHIPNSAIFKKETYNYSRGFEFIWNEMKLLVTFESDWKRAEEIMLAHARAQAEGMAEVVRRKITAMTRHYMIRFDKLTPIVYTAVRESGVELTLRYLTEARMRRTTQDALTRAILDDFAKDERVRFAYTTYRLVK